MFGFIKIWYYHFRIRQLGIKANNHRNIAYICNGALK